MIMPMCPIAAPTRNAQPVFDTRHELVKRLVKDMAGHPAALEILQTELSRLEKYHRGNNKADINMNSLMDSVRSELSTKFSVWTQHMCMFPHILRAIIDRQKLSCTRDVPGTTMWPDQIQQLGLVFRADVGNNWCYMMCPFVLLWVWAGMSGKEYDWLEKCRLNPTEKPDMVSWE